MTTFIYVQRAGQITIIDSKGGKTRFIDLHNEARRALYNYLINEDHTRRDARDPDSSYVFTSQRAAWLRQQGRPDYLTVRGIEYIWTTMKQKARQDEYALIDNITQDCQRNFDYDRRIAEQIASLMTQVAKELRL